MCHFSSASKPHPVDPYFVWLRATFDPQQAIPSTAAPKPAFCFSASGSCCTKKKELHLGFALKNSSPSKPAFAQLIFSFTMRRHLQGFVIMKMTNNQTGVATPLHLFDSATHLDHKLGHNNTTYHVFQYDYGSKPLPGPSEHPALAFLKRLLP